MIFKKHYMLWLTAILAATVSLSSAQKKNDRRSVPLEKLPRRAAVKPASSEVTSAPPAAKKNERPVEAAKSSAPGEVLPAFPIGQSAALYIYEFSRPDFLVPYVRIEHDSAGRGTITFEKKGLDQRESDPITISATTLDRLNAAYAALNFLDSAEVYQAKRDYPTLGLTSIKISDAGGRQRTAAFNFTENKNAKIIADEYRKLGYQYVWQFDMAVARINQPLTAPSLMSQLDFYLRRNEISDPQQMVPLLKELANDERIPLIARNHAARLAAQIEKAR